MKLLVLSSILFFSTVCFAETINLKMTLTKFGGDVVSEITFANIDINKFQDLSVISDDPEVECNILLSKQRDDGFQYFMLTISDFTNGQSIVGSNGYTKTDSVNLNLSADRFFCDVDIVN